MRGYSYENRRYLINGREVTPENFMISCNWGNYQEMQNLMRKMQQHARYEVRRCPCKLGRNLTEARGRLDPCNRTETRKFKNIYEILRVIAPKNNPVLVGDRCW